MLAPSPSLCLPSWGLACAEAESCILAVPWGHLPWQSLPVVMTLSLWSWTAPLLFLWNKHKDVKGWSACRLQGLWQPWACGWSPCLNGCSSQQQPQASEREAASTWLWQCRPQTCSVKGGSLKPDSCPLSCCLVLWRTGKNGGDLWAWYWVSVFFGNECVFSHVLRKRRVCSWSPAHPNCAIF